MRRLAIALLFAACAAPPDPAAKCARVADAVARCTGAEASRLDCSALAEADVDKLDAATQGVSCELFTEALPLDGDPNAAACRVLGVGCAARVGPAPVAAKTRFPVVLVNGIDTSPLFRWSARIESALRGAGADVHRATLTPYEPPRLRAPELWKRIEEVRAQTGAEKVNLLCHSLGGLDCRYVASPGGLAADTAADPATYAAAIASITTVGTAHRGTRVADVILGFVPDDAQKGAVDAFATLLGDAFSPQAIAQDTHLRDALRALSVADAPAFDAEIVDAPGVYYASWAGVSRPFGDADATFDDAALAACGGPLPFPAHDRMALPLVPFASIAGAPNDGFVTVASAKHGDFRGCIPADHMEQLGQKNLPDVNVRTGLDVAAFYTNVVAELAARGM